MTGISTLLRKDVFASASPVLAAVLLAAIDHQQGNTDRNWLDFVRQIGGFGAVMMPLLIAHLAACRLRATQASLVWFAGFVLYYIGLLLLGVGSLLPAKYWLMAAGFSLLFLLLHPQARGNAERVASTFPTLARLRVTLDGSVVALLALWVLATSSLFASTADAVRNQPLRVWIDVDRIAGHPAETLWYLCQFAVVAIILFGWYWTCRYVLVRRILRRHGVVPFGFAVTILLAIATPLVAEVVLLLPLNIPEWTLLPSENRNAFDPNNYRFTFWLTAVLLPLILVVERLLVERAAAGEQHEAARAELHLLQQQINPHFLFNTLNTLYSLCLRDRAESANAVVKLSDLLRYVVYQGQAERVTLADEVGYLRNYLDLQMLRFGNRCQLDCVWPDKTVNSTLPPMLLIMLVENAFKHGVEPADGVCKVGICVKTTGKRLQFECQNSVPTVPEDGAPGLGLVNLRRRLELIYGAAFLLETGMVGKTWRSRLELDLGP